MQSLQVFHISATICSAICGSIVAALASRSHNDFHLHFDISDICALTVFLLLEWNLLSPNGINILSLCRDSRYLLSFGLILSNLLAFIIQFHVDGNENSKAFVSLSVLQYILSVGCITSLCFRPELINLDSSGALKIEYHAIGFSTFACCYQILAAAMQVHDPRYQKNTAYAAWVFWSVAFIELSLICGRWVYLRTIQSDTNARDRSIKLSDPVYFFLLLTFFLSDFVIAQYYTNTASYDAIWGHARLKSQWTLQKAFMILVVVMPATLDSIELIHKLQSMLDQQVISNCVLSWDHQMSRTNLL